MKAAVFQITRIIGVAAPSAVVGVPPVTEGDGVILHGEFTGRSYLLRDSQGVDSAPEIFGAEVSADLKLIIVFSEGAVADIGSGGAAGVRLDGIDIELAPGAALPGEGDMVPGGWVEITGVDPDDLGPVAPAVDDRLDLADIPVNPEIVRALFPDNGLLPGIIIPVRVDPGLDGEDLIAVEVVFVVAGVGAIHVAAAQEIEAVVETAGRVIVPVGALDSAGGECVIVETIVVAVVVKMPVASRLVVVPDRGADGSVANSGVSRGNLHIGSEKIPPALAAICGIAGINFFPVTSIFKPEIVGVEIRAGGIHADITTVLGAGSSQDIVRGGVGGKRSPRAGGKGLPVA